MNFAKLKKYIFKYKKFEIGGAKIIFFQRVSIMILLLGKMEQYHPLKF
jgi:hypothetical protein